MLDLEELFKKRPFIYLINGDYYAFGCGYVRHVIDMVIM